MNLFINLLYIYIRSHGFAVVLVFCEIFFTFTKTNEHYFNGGAIFLFWFSWPVQEWAAGGTSAGLQAMGGGSFLGNKEVK